MLRIKEIEELVRNKLKGDAIGDLHKLSFAEKINCTYNQILMPQDQTTSMDYVFQTLIQKLPND